jgi:hypothetical protein
MSMVSDSLGGDTRLVDRYAGSAWLEWWANRDTCLGSVEVNLQVTVDEEGWRASATFATPLEGEAQETWEFLMRLDPYFTLRLREDARATIEVRVEELEGAKRLALSAA